MRILSVRRQAINVFVFSITLIVLNVASINYLITKDLDDADIWDNYYIAQAVDAKIIGVQNLENADLSRLTGKIIAIDPGHGGIDNGASGHGNQEKDINLKIAFELSRILKDNGATPILTRDSDLDYYTKGKGGKRNDILKRSEIIKESNAEVFVSIHCNASGDFKWSGAQVFYNSKMPESKKLALIVQESLKKFPVGNKREAKQDSNILLLKSLNVPGVLIETGFISNKNEAKALAEEHYQKDIALSIARALAYHFSNN